MNRERSRSCRQLPAVGSRRAILLLLVVLLCARELAGQDFPQPLFQAPFTLPNPGARSLGFGGAFVALADDATAAIANPAGLVQLLEPEVSLDVRVWDFSTRYTVGGRVAGQPTGTGLDTTAGLRFADSNDRLAGLSFLSYVYPKRRWALAFHRHLQGNFESATETQGLFTEGPGGTRRVADQRTTSDFEFLTYGLSGAFRITDQLSVGVGLVYVDGQLTLEASTYARDDDAPQGLFEPISYLPQRLMIDQALTLDDSDWVFNAGALLKLSSSWSIGVVYRKGSSFEFRGYAEAGPENGFGLPAGTVILSTSLGDIAFPDGYGAGVAYRAPTGRMTVSFEWDEVEYADVADSLDLDDQVIDDAHELRIGGEYVFLDLTPVIGVRLGAWIDPDHLMRGNGSEPIVDALLQPGDDELHYSTGLGFAYETFQLDVGIDLSERSNTLSISAVFSL